MRDVYGVLPEHRARHDSQHRLVGGGQHHRRRDSVVIGACPVPRRDAPAVTRHQPGEAVLRYRGRQIVPDAALVVEELSRDDSADRVAPEVVRPGATAPIPEEPRHGICAARLQLVTKDVAVCHAHSIAHTKHLDDRVPSPAGSGSGKSSCWKECVVDWTLEVVVLPVSDIDRSISFYRDQVGFALDHDTRTEQMHIAQLTPAGSGCSIVMGDLPAYNEMAPGSIRGLQLCVADAAAAREELLGRGVEATEITVIDERDGGTLFGFSDPDGNTWAVQQLKARATKPLIPKDS